MTANLHKRPDDITCWNQFRLGNDLALGQLMKMYYAALYQYGCSFSNRPDLVDDVIQDLFYSFWNRRAHLPDVIYVKTYLLSALRNRLIDILRKPNRMIRTSDTDWNETDLFAGGFIIEKQLIDDEQQQEQTQQLQKLVEKLSKRQREVIYLRFYQDLDNEAIAELMQVNRQSVANLISSALLRIRQNWRTCCLVLVSLLGAISLK